MELKELLKLNQTVPGFMSGIQPLILYVIFSKYNNEQCQGVEIGSAHGKSSMIIAEAIKKGLLYCIDTWDGTSLYKSEFDHETIKLRGYPEKGTVNTMEFFLKNTSMMQNIIPIKGSSPQVVKDWTKPVDFVFLDVNHKNPNDRENLDFWLPKIKKNGCLVGHDYGEQFPDVLENVNYLEKLLNQPVTVYPKTSIWKFDIN